MLKWSSIEFVALLLVVGMTLSFNQDVKAFEETASCSQQSQAENIANETLLDSILRDVEHLAQPTLNYEYSSQYIEHTAYNLSYNSDYKVPNWVFYELTREELVGNVARKDNFRPDPQVSSIASAQLNDYKKSGYDRGHIAPAADFSWSIEAKDESFFLSNMCPQVPSFNRGIWKSLEEKVRYWAERDSAICIVAGPVLPMDDDTAYTTIGENKVIVPKLFYKVVLSLKKDGMQAIAFVMANEGSSASLQDYVVTVDSIENLTKIDFFPIFPDEMENTIEEKVDMNYWFE